MLASFLMINIICVTYFILSIVCYIIGIGSMVVFFWFIQFVIDQTGNTFFWTPLIFNTLLFMIFPIQHSVLVRPSIKEKIQKAVPPLFERPIYVATSGFAMMIIIFGWQRFGPSLYRLETAWPFDLVFYLAIGLILLAIKNLNHNSMFGLKQGYALWKKTEISDKGLQTAGLYGRIRHPLTSLLILALWSHESMSMARLQWNILFTAYAILGTYFEERDLIKNFGQEYLNYRKHVPAFIPKIL
jgi:protein-S-isoprenylcysteine O-methyltransferase Ste14